MATYDVGGRSAIVTGAGSGIGHAIARLLAANGAAVLVTDINEVSVKAVVDEIHAAGGTAASLVGDVTDQEFAERCVAAAGELGPLRIAVNNAGVGGPLALVGEYPLDSWRRVIETNQNAVFYGLRAQLPAIAAAEGGGAIVNIASILGSVGFAYNAAYVTAKHAIVGLTKNAALEYAAHRREPRRGDPGVHREQARPRTARHTGRGCRAGGLPGLRRRILHHRQLPPGRRRLHRYVKGPCPGRTRNARRPSCRSARHAARRCPPGRPCNIAGCGSPAARSASPPPTTTSTRSASTSAAASGWPSSGPARSTRPASRNPRSPGSATTASRFTTRSTSPGRSS